MTRQHILIDLETLSTSPNAKVLAIGAVRFDPMQNDPFGEKMDTFEANLDILDDPKGVIDASTVLWWLRQDREAQNRTFGPQVFRSVVREELLRFQKWVYASPATHIWSNGPTFDEVILSNLMKRHDLGWPFSYYMSRCYRTAIEMSGIQKLTHAETGTVPHTALGDAVNQARNVVRAYGREV